MPKKPKGFCDSLCTGHPFQLARLWAEMPKKPKGFCDMVFAPSGFFLVALWQKCQRSRKAFVTAPEVERAQRFAFQGRNAKEAERLL